MELAIENEIDRFTLAIDVINRVPRLQAAGAHAKEKFRNMQIASRTYAHTHGIDEPEVIAWRWPFGKDS
jgi:xylulose-5-phosphate/fructose-6-phosphate phosphoketolase